MKKIIFLSTVPLFFLYAETSVPEQNVTADLEEKVEKSNSSWSRAESLSSREKQDRAREKMEKDVEKMIQETMDKRDKGTQ